MAKSKKGKMTPAKVAKERERLEEAVSEAQYDYNCAIDTKIAANHRWIQAKNEMNAATEHLDGCQADFDAFEQTLFDVEGDLEDFNEKYPEDDDA